MISVIFLGSFSKTAPLPDLRIFGTEQPQFKSMSAGFKGIKAAAALRAESGLAANN